MEKTIKYLQDGEYHYATVKDVGDLEQLKTQHKEDLVTALNELFTTGGDSKTNGYDDLVKKVSDTRTSLNGVNSEVSNVKNKINDITSNGGGRNYLRDSDKSISGWGQDLGTIPNEVLNSLAGETITVSVDVEWSNFQYDDTHSKQSRLGFELSVIGSDGNHYWWGAWKAPVTPNGKERVSATITLPANVTFDVRNNGKSGYVSINGTGIVSHAKIEGGTVAHDWSPAPEDVDSAIGNVNTKIDQTANGINNTITDINGKVVANDEAIAQAKKDLQDALTQFQTFNDEIEQAKKDAETKLADAKQALKDEFNNNLADAQKANQKQLEDKIAVIQGNLDTTSNTLNDVKTQLTNAKLDYGAVNTSIQKLNDTLSTKLSSTDLDPLRTSIQSQETEIQQAKDSIATKTSKAEFDVLSGRVGNAEAKINQQADEISLGVKKSELNGAIDNYQIEGANRLRNTIDFDIDGGYWKLDQYDIKSTADVHPYDQAHDVSALVLQKTGSAKQDVDFTNEDLGQNFVVSMWNKKDAQPQVWYGNTQLTNRQVAEIKGDYERSFFTFIPTNVNVKTIMFKYDAGTVDQLVIGEPKLELGTKPKAYAPNPNDEHKQIVDTKAELKIASDKIESTVEKQTKTDDNINQLSSRITQTEQGITATNDLITKTKDGLIKDYTGKIDASAKSLSSEFDEKTDEKIGQITDSGENLILNSAFTNETDRKDKWQNISDKVNIVADNNGLMWAHMSQTGLTADNPISLTSNYFPIKQGKITVGVDIKSDNTNGLSGAKILVLQTYNANKQRVDFTEISLENMGLTIQQLAAGESHRGVYRLGNDRSDAVYMTVKAVLPRNGSIYFTNFSAKLSSIDNGGYTPNADDLKRQILNQKTKIEQNSQQITLKASSTELRDVQTIANGAVSVANQANSNANTANTNATNAVSVANNANNNANQAKSNANSAVTTANNAKSTADNANNSANNAVNTANTANNKVTAIQANGGGVNLAKGTDKFLESTTSYGAASIGGLTPEEWKQYEGKTLTFSITIEWKNWQTYGNNRVGWELAFHVGGKAIWDNDKSPHLWISGQANGSSGKKRLSTTITVPDNIDGDSITGQVAYIQSHADYFKISDLMVEEGTVAHTWSPAPEDIQTQIDQARTDIQSTLTVANNGITAATNLKTTYDNYVQKNDANIKLLGDRITNEVSKITSNGGGVNLLQGTGTVSGDVASGGGAIVKGAFNGYDAVKTNGAWDERYINLKSALGRTDAKAGDWYTISVYVKADKQIDTGSLLVPRALGSAAYANDGFLPSIWMKDRPITTQWQQYSWSFQINDVSLQRQNTRIEYDHGTGDNWIYWGGWMLEKGIVAHDWQPAPEDTQSQIEAVSSKIDQTATSITSTVNSTKQDLQGQIDSANTKITQTADSITEQLKSYSKTGDMQNYVNTTVQKTADGINTKVSGIESKVDSTKQDLQGQITQTANDINGKVSGVENKVDNASSKINDITSNGGGRNLWIDSKSFQHINVNVPTVDWSTDSNGIATAHITGTGGFYGAWQSVYANGTDPFAIGDSGTFSVEMKGTGTITIGRENDFQKSVTLTNDWARYSVSGVVNHKNSAHIIYNESGQNCDAYVRLPMVEKGTIAHDWQPAPEDTQSQIDANKTSAANAHTSADNANTTANSALTKADSAVSVANQANTNASSAVNTANNAINTANTANTNASSAVSVANNANITANTANSNANQAVTKASNAINTANTANTNASSAVSVANNANITANTANSNANSANNTANSAVTTANSAVNTANNANTTANQANSKVAAIQANGGGRNLLIGSDPTLSNRPSLGGVTEANIDGVKAWHSNNADNIFFNISLDANTTYTYSALIKADDAGELGFSCYGHFQVRNPNAHNQADPTHEDIPSKRDYHGINVPANQWIRIYYTFTTNDLDGSTFGVFPSYAGHTVYVRHLMLEKGTVAHDWSPAPEDVDAKITTNSTAIEQNKKAIALKADQTTVDKINGTVGQLQSTLTVQAGQIQGKVTEAQVNDILNGKGYATQSWAESNFRMKSDSITLEVKKITDPISDRVDKVNSNLDNLQIGGRNLLLNTDKDISVTSHTTDGWPAWANIDTGFSFEHGKTYTFSAEAKNSSDKVTEASIRVFESSTNTQVGIYAFPADGNRHSVTFTIPNDTHNYHLLLYAGHAGSIPGVDVTTTYHHPKLEFGTKATDWSPAPEDTSAEIKSAKDEAINVASGKVDTSHKELQGQIDTSNKELQGIKDVTQWHTVSGPLDLNDLKNQTRIFYRDTQDKNSAVNGWQYIVVDSSSDRVTQTVWKDNSTIQYIRQFTGTWWSNWVRQTNQNDIDEAKTGLREEIKSAKDAAINVANDNIEIKVNELKTTYEETLNTKINEVKTASEKFTSDGIEQTVTKITEVKNDVDRLGDKVDGIQVGGRNLLIGTGEGELSGKSYSFGNYQIAGGLQPGRTYTLSGWGRVDQNALNHKQNIFIDAYAEDWSWSVSLNITASLTHQYNKVTFTTPTGKQLHPWVTVYLSHPDGGTNENNNDAISGTAFIKKLKLEEGNIATDYTHAPEDVAQQITDTNKKIDTQTLDNANIDNMRIQGHYFVRNLTGTPIPGWVYVDVMGNNNDRIRQDVYADQNSQHKYRSWNGSRWSNWEQGAYLSDVNNVKTEVTASIKNLGDRVTTEVNSVTNKIDAIQVGGTNLVQNGDANAYGATPWPNTLFQNHDFYFNGTKKMFNLHTSNKDEIVADNAKWFPVLPGHQYTLSFKGFMSVNVSSYDVWLLGKKADAQGGWTNSFSVISGQRLSSSCCDTVTKTITIPSDWNNYVAYIRFDNNGSTDGNDAVFFFNEVKFEEGNKATSYSPAPDDFVEAIKEINTKWDVANGQIQGKVTATDVNNILNGKGYATQSWAQTMFQMKKDSITLQAVRDNITNGIQNQVDGINKKIDTQTLDSANIDNMRTQGHYFVKNLTGNPIGGWVYVDVNCADQWRIRQDVYQDIGGRHVYRRLNGSSWTEWTTDVNNENVVSQINITPEQIKIASNKIEIDGNTYIHGELNVPNVKLKGNNGIVDLSGDGINITKDDGAGISITNNGIQLTANTNGQNEVEGVLTTAWNLNNKNQNGIGLILTTEQDLGKPYGGDILTIGSMPKPGLIHAAMVFDATGITSDYKKGFNWMAPHTLDGDGGVLRFPGAQDDLLLYASNIPGSRQSEYKQPTMRLVNGQYQGTAGIQFQWYDIVPFGRITSSMSYMSAVGTDGDDGLAVSWYSWTGWYGGRKVPSLVSTSSNGSRRNGGFAFYPGGEVCFWQGDFRSNLRWDGLRNES